MYRYSCIPTSPLRPPSYTTSTSDASQVLLNRALPCSSLRLDINIAILLQLELQILADPLHRIRTDEEMRIVQVLDDEPQAVGRVLVQLEQDLLDGGVAVV